jgi:hypothetical protein
MPHGSTKKPLAWQAVFLCNLFKRSNGKAGATAAGFAGVGITKGKAPIIESVMPIDLHAQQIDLVSLFHNAGNTLYVK